MCSALIIHALRYSTVSDGRLLDFRLVLEGEDEDTELTETSRGTMLSVPTLPAVNWVSIIVIAVFIVGFCGDVNKCDCNGVLSFSAWRWDLQVKEWESICGRRLEDVTSIEVASSIEVTASGIKHRGDRYRCPRKRQCLGVRQQKRSVLIGGKVWCGIRQIWSLNYLQIGG